MNHSSNQSSRTLGFMGLSSALHLSLIVALATLSFVKAQPLEKETIQIEVLSETRLSSEKVAAISNAPEKAKTPAASTQAATPSPAPAKISAPKLSQSHNSTTAPTKAASPLSVSQVAESPTADFDSDIDSSLASAEASEAIDSSLPEAETLSAAAPVEAKDIDTTDLDSEVGAMTQASSSQNSSSDEALEKNIQSHIEEMQNLTSRHLQEGEKKTQSLMATNDQDLKSAAAQDSQRLAQERSKYAHALAAQKFTESQKGAPSPGEGSASSTASTGAGESALSVRALGELKQMNGNPRPRYDAQDRLKQRKGLVSFLAYVTQEGNLKDFKILQSTGHRELDLKTLKALKSWKFYPGQQGLVEIPIQWDLVGGPQEAETTLRRVNVAK